MLSNEVTFLLLLNLKVQGVPNSQVVLGTLFILFPGNPEHRNQSTFCLHIWLTFCHLYFQGNILVYISSCTLPLRTLTAYSTYTRAHIHTHANMHTHMHTHVHTFTHRHTRAQHVHTKMHAHTYRHTHTQTHTHEHIHAQRHTCVHTETHTCVHSAHMHT